MKVGDLVRFLATENTNVFGIVMEIINEYLVGVLWTNSEHIYMEAVNNLEVIND